MKNAILLTFMIFCLIFSVFNCSIAEAGSDSSNNSGGTSISSSSSSFSPLIFFDEFTNATDATIFTSYNGYTTNSINPANPMYLILGGSYSVFNGIVEITGATITIGARDAAFTTSTSKPEGCFDLSSPYTIYIGISYLASGSGSDSKFYVMVDNNTQTASSSPLGSSSLFFQKRFAELQTGELVIENTTVATKNSFICLRTDSSAVIRIDYIKIMKK